MLRGHAEMREHAHGTVEALDKETLDKESRVSRPMGGRSWATHLASKQEGTQQGLAPQEHIPYPTPPPYWLSLTRRSRSFISLIGYSNDFSIDKNK